MSGRRTSAAARTVEPSMWDDPSVSTEFAGVWHGRTGDLSPIQRLALGVLEMAIDDYYQRGYTNRADPATRTRERRMHRETAERWLASDEDRYVLSYVRVCQTLNLDPSAVRRAIRSSH